MQPPPRAIHSHAQSPTGFVAIGQAMQLGQAMPAAVDVVLWFVEAAGFVLLLATVALALSGLQEKVQK